MIGAIIVLIVLVVCLLTAFNNDLLYQKQISERIYNNSLYQKQIAEKMYSEEEVRKITLDFFYHWWNAKGNNTEEGFNEWFEQFKKKL